ncbi:hypothetical protein B5M09_010553 [Aphanomyces astaci]|uniref:F-box domain-containing protein n=1 Tax=Aphanomyces astaci TaxID=112090 RepID=A0A425CVA1_APHAT|nr:hypothetical protein B5M09_010553 [Aphanomyces astaci]
MVLSYVPPLPNYVTWQLVCRRWRAMLLSLPAFDLNFDIVRPVDNGTRYLTLLQRWPMLRSVTMTRDIFVSNELTWQLGLSQLVHLQHVSLRHTHTKALQELFKACHSLRTVSVLGCSDARLPTVKTSLPFLQKLELQAASLANNSSIVSILRNAPQLTHLVVSVLAQLAASCPLIRQVSCRGVSRAVRQRCALQCHTHAMSYERVLVATNASAYRKDNVGVDFAAKPIKKTSAGLLPYGLDEDYNPRDHHQEFEEDDTDASQRRGRNAPGSRPATPRRNTRR